MSVYSHPPFVIFSLPRSRTAWLSRYLTYGPWVCGHEECRYWRTMEDVKSWFMQPFIGTCETEAMHFWRLLPRVAPEARVVTIRRPVQEVHDSLMRLNIGQGGPQLLRYLRNLDSKLDQIEHRLGVMRIEFSDLVNEEACRLVFERCLGLEHNTVWWKRWSEINLQIDIQVRLRYMMTHLPQMVKMRDVAKYQVLVDLHSQHDPAPYGNLSIQEEPLEEVVRDGKEMLEGHAFRAGGVRDDWKADLQTLENMNRLGLLQVMTARANGKLFGYLVTIMDAPGMSPRVATQSEFYASSEWPGAGLKLQRAALAALAAKGVDQVFMRSGTGPGARIETLYKRMGAEPEGKLFKIRINP